MLSKKINESFITHTHTHASVHCGALDCWGGWDHEEKYLWGITKIDFVLFWANYAYSILFPGHDFGGVSVYVTRPFFPGMILYNVQHLKDLFLCIVSVFTNYLRHLKGSVGLLPGE